MTNKSKLKIGPEWVPRLSIKIRKDQHFDLQELVPWGTRTQIFEKLIDGLLDSIKKDGDAVMGALLRGKIKFVPVKK